LPDLASKARSAQGGLAVIGHRPLDSRIKSTEPLIDSVSCFAPVTVESKCFQKQIKSGIENDKFQKEQDDEDSVSGCAAATCTGRVDTLHRQRPSRPGRSKARSDTGRGAG
jgi:hypothetical protein